MKEQSRRAKRAASLIQSEVARLLLTDLADPRVQGSSVTEVVVTNDLRHARILFESHVSVREALEGFRKATPFIRRSLAQVLDMRTIPELTFEKDDRPEELHRLMGVMDSLQGP